MNRKLFHGLVVVGVIIGLGLRLYPIVTEQIFFHFDSARDWLWIRDMVMSKKPQLVGPWSSLNGVFYGPFTYYMLVPFFVLFDGNPIAGSIAAFIIQILALGGFYFIVRRGINYVAAAIGLFLLAISPLAANIATFIFQSNPSFGLGVMWLWGLWWIAKGNKRGVAVAMLALGLGMHTNLFFTLFQLPFLVLLWWKRKLRVSVRWLGLSLMALSIPLVPQIVFEFRHQFIQTKSLWQFLIGENHSLGTALDWGQRWLDRSNVLTSLMAEFLLPMPMWIVFMVLVLATLKGYRVWKKMSQTDYRRLIALATFSLVWFVIASFTFSGQLKLWYLYWVMPTLALLWGWWWSEIQQKGKKYAVMVIFILLSMAGVRLYTSINDINKQNDDLKLLRQQKTIVDKVLAMAKGKSFAAYVYTESVYDYPYQFLWWWMEQKTGESPVAYGYLPDKYEYVLNKKNYDPHIRDIEEMYLIMEKDNPASDYRWETWLKAFYEYTPVEKIELFNGTIIEKRIRNN